MAGHGYTKSDLRMARWLDKEETTMHTGILDIALSLCCKFLTQVCGVLVFDVLDNRVPAAACQHYYFQRDTFTAYHLSLFT